MSDIQDRFNLLIFEDAQEVMERRAIEARNRENKLDKIEKSGYCEGMTCECRSRENVEWRHAMTWYPWDLDERPDEDPNRLLFLCPKCYDEYKYHWQEMWDMANAGRL